MVRHPFSVIRSYINSQMSLWPTPETSIDKFAVKLVSGIYGGSWQDNVLSWKMAATDREMIFIRYEDLSENPIEVIVKIANFLGRKTTIEEAKEINLKSSLERMRRL